MGPGPARPVVQRLQLPDHQRAFRHRCAHQRRLRTHNRGAGARYTRTRRPVRLVYVETQPGRAAAMRRERQIKRYQRGQKQALIETYQNGGTEQP